MAGNTYDAQTEENGSSWRPRSWSAVERRSEGPFKSRNWRLRRPSVRWVRWPTAQRPGRKFARHVRSETTPSSDVIASQPSNSRPAAQAKKEGAQPSGS